jgi:D-alanyl-D-alanine carboxypeptidase/D-alanyl-D-alanine-endopeptidase (penicillin-binding protein 4)
MNVRKFSLLLLFFNCWMLLWTQNPAALNAFLQKKSVAHAAVSFKAIDLNTGKTLASHNEKAAITPASNMKIITSSTALDILGEDFYFETPLVYDGVIENSTLTGDLYIKGAGDPTLGSEFLGEDKENFLKTWLIALHNAGIKSIIGDIIVLDQLFGYEGVSPKWMLEDLGTYYGPGIYGISVFDNMSRIYVQSGAPGTEVQILSTKPQLELSFTNEMKAGENNSDNSGVFGLPFSNERRLQGTVPPNRASYTLNSDIPDPGLLLAQYFRTYLLNNGISVSGKATTYRLDPKLPQTERKIGSVYSLHLAKIVREINVDSNNHYIEHLYKLLTLLKGVDIQAYWKEKGLDSEALFMFDGSGLSPSNALSAGFIIEILTYMDKKYGQSGAFYNSLPIAGKEGTVASLLKNTPLEGKAHLKSGSITLVQAYSGYIEKGNNRYAVSLIINNFSGSRTDLRKDIEQLLVGLF